MTAQRFHISPQDGTPRRCTAKIHCPVGGEHYSSEEDARRAFERSMESFKFSSSAHRDFPVNRRGAISGEQFEVEFARKFPVGSEVLFHGFPHTVEVSEKPEYEGGEGKTDVYLKLKDPDGVSHEVKVSLKKDNADFLENKLNLKRAVAILGSEAEVENLTNHLYQELEEELNIRQVDFPEKVGRTEAGSYTVGWRMDIVTRKTGELSIRLPLSHEQLMNCYAGTSIVGDKRNALVGGFPVKDSGVATHFLRGNPEAVLELSPNEILSRVESIEDHVRRNPEVYVKLSALNYRESKQDVTSYSSVLFGVNREAGIIEKTGLKKRADEIAIREIPGFVPKPYGPSRPR